MKILKEYEEVLPLTFQKASFSNRVNLRNTRAKFLSVKTLHSNKVRKESFYKPISKIISVK